MRACHFSLGNDRVQYESTARRDVFKCAETMKRTRVEPTRPKESNFSLGNDQVDYMSCTKSTYCYNRDEFKPQRLSIEAKRELRASHFVIGNDSVDYRTSNTLERIELSKHKPPVITLGSGASNALRETHFVLGSDRTDYTSTTKAQTCNVAELYPQLNSDLDY